MENPSDICKNDVNLSDTDTDITHATDTSEVPVTQNVVKYDVKLKVDRDTDDEISKIKSCVGEVVEDIVHKIDEENVEGVNQMPETAGPMENIDIVHTENTSMICSDDSATADSSVVSEYDVQIKTDETIAQPCPVHGNKPPDVDIVPADLTVVDSGQPPGYVKAEAESEAPAVETASLDIYINTDASPTADSIRKSKKNS